VPSKEAPVLRRRGTLLEPNNSSEALVLAGRTILTAFGYEVVRCRRYETIVEVQSFELQEGCEPSGGNGETLVPASVILDAGVPKPNGFAAAVVAGYLRTQSTPVLPVLDLIV